MTLRAGGDVSCRECLQFFAVVMCVLTFAVGILMFACPAPSSQIPPSLQNP